MSLAPAIKKKWLTNQFFRMWPRALFHKQAGKQFIQKHLHGPGVYVLYREDLPYYIGKTDKLARRLTQHALKPNTRYYNFWNYFSAFEIDDPILRNEIEAILISAMPTANSAHPKFQRKKLDRNVARMLNEVQAFMLTGAEDESPEERPEESGDGESS
jgi:GIY-YIG catalytic domain